MRAAEPLGDFGAIKVEWGCWSVGPARNQQQQQDQRQLVVVGVPCPFNGDSVQEGLFVWRVHGLDGTTAADAAAADAAASTAGQTKDGEKSEDEDDEEGDEEDESNTGLPLVDPSPDILPGFIQGLQALEICPRRALLLGADCHGGLFVQSERFTTGFPGPMYAPGYTILGNNRTYLEREEELDKVVVPEGGDGKGTEEEADSEAAVPDEEGEVDVVVGLEVGRRGGGDAMMLQIQPRPIYVNRCLSEHLAFPLVPFSGGIHRKRKLHEKQGWGERGRGEEEEKEEGEALPTGFGEYLPMPQALVTLARKKRKAEQTAKEKEGGKEGGRGGLSVSSQRFRAVETWAAKGRTMIKHALARELAESEGKSETAAAAAAAAEKGGEKAKAKEAAAANAAKIAAAPTRQELQQEQEQQREQQHGQQ